jgi:hypothetical protein
MHSGWFLDCAAINKVVDVVLNGRDAFTHSRRNLAH